MNVANPMHWVCAECRRLGHAVCACASRIAAHGTKAAICSLVTVGVVVDAVGAYGGAPSGDTVVPTFEVGIVASTSLSSVAAVAHVQYIANQVTGDKVALFWGDPADWRGRPAAEPPNSIAEIARILLP